MSVPAARILACACLSLVAAPLCVTAQADKQPSDKTAAAKAKTTSERLAACAEKYATAKTYRDEGSLVAEFEVPGTGREVAEKKPFRTAFERDGRFFWEFRGSAVPGAKADQTYAVWSSDQKDFKSYWTLTKQKTSFTDLQMALTGPTGVSGGSALAITPLLCPDALRAHRITNLKEPADKGSETIDGHECTKVEGKTLQSVVTIWIDKDMAIRKIYQVMEVDPSKLPAGPGKDMGKFTVKTTMTFKPVFDEKIEDDRFAPPAAAN